MTKKEQTVTITIEVKENDLIIKSNTNNLITSIIIAEASAKSTNDLARFTNELGAEIVELRKEVPNPAEQ